MANWYAGQEKKKFDFYQTMTDKVIGHLEGGENFLEYLYMVSTPVNGVTNQKYDANSKLLLMMEQQRNHSSDPRFFTFDQIKEMGCIVDYGAKSTVVVVIDKLFDENGKILPKQEQKTHLENVFHASDVKKRAYLCDKEGKKILLTDENGNTRFSRRDGQPLYRYIDTPLPAVESEQKTKDYLMPDNAADLLKEAADKVKGSGQRDDVVDTFHNTLAAMLIAAESNIKENLFINPDKLAEYKPEIVELLKNDKKAYANAVYQASRIAKEYKSLAWNYSKKNANSIAVDEQVPFAPAPEPKTGEDIPFNAVPEPAVPDTAEKVEKKSEEPVEAGVKEQVDSPVMAISQNLATKFFEMMKAMNVSDQEIVSGFSHIKEQGMKLVMENSHQKENVSVR